MAQVTLNPTKNTYLISTAATTNIGTSSTNVDVGENKGGSNDIRRALMHFDVSSIPASATVTSATFRISDTGTDLATNNRTMRVYRMLRDWVEGDGSAGSGATWNTYDGTNNWGTAGAANTTTDREATDIGGVELPGTEVAQYYSVTLTTSEVQDWVDGTVANNGILLQMETETDDLHRLEARLSTNKPELIVDYTLGETETGYSFIM